MLQKGKQYMLARWLMIHNVDKYVDNCCCQMYKLYVNSCNTLAKYGYKWPVKA